MRRAKPAQLVSQVGMRGNRVEVVDFERVRVLGWRVVVDRSAADPAAGVDGLAAGPTKGREARSVPVPGFVLDELSVACRGKGPSDLVFPGRDGGYLPRPRSATGWFDAAVKRAGVQPITPHDLRHACASLAVSAGVNVLALARMLGHKDPSVTLRIYADLFDTDLDAVAATLHSRYHAGRAASLKDSPERRGE